MRRRVERWNLVALAMMLVAAPASLAAQATNTAVPPPTPTPTPAPAPAGDSVGPPQLRDFNLNGTVTQPAQPATPTPTPTPAPTPRPPVARDTPPRAVPGPVATAPAPEASPDREPAPAATPVEEPLVAEPLPGDIPAPLPDPIAQAPDATSDAGETGAAWWPWLAALLAIALGAGLLWWRRQQHGGERYATDHSDVGALVATPEAAPVPAPAPAPAPVPAPLPRTTPTPPRPAPRATPPVAAPPAPPPAPVADGIVSSRVTAAPIGDGIVSSRLKPALSFELVPIRAETDTAEGAALTFDLMVINQGSAPARDVLIEAKLINAGPQVDAEVGRFFMQPAGTGDPLPMIAPMGRVLLKMRVAASAPNLAPLVVEGRKLLVPMIAVNAAYRWNGGELTDSASFLVGRGEAEGGKMAPFRLDLGARSWSQLGARLHSSGLQR